MCYTKINIMQILFFGSKFMKKIVSLILSLIVIVACFTACSEKAFTYYNYDDIGEYISVSQYKDIEFAQSSPEVIDKIQEKYHKDMKSYNLHTSQLMPKGTKVQNNDTVNIDYVGKIDGVAFDGGTANGYNLVIGSDTFIDGFEDGLIGATIGQTVDLNLTFPENYKNPEVAGKKAVFTVKVNSITRNLYPTLSSVGEVMAKEMGYKDLAAYETAVINSIKTEYVWTKKIVELSTVAKYPEKELNKNREYYETLYQNLVSSYGQEAVNTAVTSSAQNRTKEELVGYYIAQKENITLDEAELLEKVKDTYGEDYTEIELESVRLSLTMEKAINFVLEHVKVK